MERSVKFTVSVPETVFKELEALRRQTRTSRSRLIRQALLGLGPEAAMRPAEEAPPGTVIIEGSAGYRTPAPSLKGMTDKAERRRLAIAAAGRFRSGASDLSADHDKHLEDAYAAVSGPGSSSELEAGRKP